MKLPDLDDMATAFKEDEAIKTFLIAHPETYVGFGRTDLYDQAFLIRSPHSKTILGSGDTFRDAIADFERGERMP